MTRGQVRAWLDRYIAAWHSNERKPIEALFADEVVYRFRPYAGYPAAVGIDAVVRAWLEDTRDQPGTWQASYEPYAVEGDRAVATGWSRYFATATGPERLYSNPTAYSFASTTTAAAPSSRSSTSKSHRTRVSMGLRPAAR